MRAHRDQTLDVARGVAIVLVVAGHSLRGLTAAGIAPASPTVVWADTALYVTHLPVFAFATGLLMPAAVSRAGSAAYLRRRAGLIVYLYLLWTLIEGTAEVVTSGVKNVPVTWLDVLKIWVPIGHLWFLPCLLIATIVVIGVRPWGTGVPRWIGVVACVGVSLACWGVSGDVVGTQGWGILLFFVTGALFTHGRLEALLARTGPALLVVVGLAGTGLAVLLSGLGATAPTVVASRTPASILLGVGASVGAVVGVLALSALAARRPRGERWLALFGRVSLQIYLAHIIVTAGTRVLLVRIGVRQTWIHLVLAVVLGVLVPVALDRVTRRTPWLFSPPWEAARRPRP